MDEAIPARPHDEAATDADAGACAVVGPSHRLIAKPLPFNTFRENVIVLSRSSTALRPERLAGVRKVEVRVNGRSLMASPMICDDPTMIGPDEAGLPQPAFRHLGVQASVDVAVVHALFQPRIAEALRSAGARSIISTDSCAHPSNAMPLASLLAATLSQEFAA